MGGVSFRIHQVRSHMPQPEPASPSPNAGGIHVSRGVRLRIPAGGLSIRMASERPGMEVTRVELQLDTCVLWLEIALEHRAAARSAHGALLEAKAAGVEFAALLEREFKSSVQAAVAAATFFEALYASTLDRVSAKPTPHVPGRRQSQPRYARVTEQLRMSFGL